MYNSVEVDGRMGLAQILSRSVVQSLLAKVGTWRV